MSSVRKKKYSYKNKNKHLYIMIIRYDVLERASCSNTTNLSASFKKNIYIKTTQQQLQHLKQHNSLTDQKLVKEWKTTFLL